MLKRLWAIAAFGSLALGGCANVTRNFGSVDFDITVLRAGRPAPYQRLVIWINETRIERVTDAQGKLVFSEGYSWEGQTLAVVGPILHAPKPVVALSLATDPNQQYDGDPHPLSEPHNAWKETIRLDVP